MYRSILYGGIMYKFNNKAFLFMTLVVVWMGVIFLFSNMNSKSSNGGSLSIIGVGVSFVNKVTTKIGFTDRISYYESMNIARKLNYPFRKLMHISEYLILVILIYSLLYFLGVEKRIIISFIICFIYAMCDEYHQSFLDRSGRFADVLIDSIGIIIGLISSYYYIFKEGNTNVSKNIK